MTDQMKKSGNGVSLWLALSLALNAGLIGVVGGRMLAGSDRFDDHDRHRKAIHRFETDLPHTERRKVRRQLVMGWRESDEERQALREAHKAVIEAASTEPVDQEKLDKAFADMRAAENVLRAKMHEAMANYLINASPEHRAMFLQEFRRFPQIMATSPPRPPKKRFRHDDGPPPRDNGAYPERDSPPPSEDD